MIFSSLRIRPRSREALLGSLLLAGNAVAFAQQYTISTVAGGVPPATPAAGAAVPIGPPQRIAADPAGNLYFTSLNSVFKLDPNGTVTVVAGNSRPGFSGDGGPATQAHLDNPQGIAIDAAGDIFIADTGNNRIRAVTPDGNIQTVAGTGAAALYPINGPATQCPLYSPGGVAVDAFFNVYIADTGNNFIRRVTPDGNLSSFAGVPYSGFAGDGGAALNANMHGPQDVAVDKNGVVYIADTGNARIRTVTTDGIIHTVAGNGGLGFAGDGAAATGAALSQPYAVSIDSQGQIYIADLGNLRIRKVDAKGNISTVAGTGFPGFAGDGAAGTKATLTLPSGVAVASSNVYIADQWNLRIRRIDSSGNIATVAGNGGFSYSGDGGPAARAQLNTPQGVALDPAGNLYIADSRNAVVRKIAAADQTISTLPGTSLVYPRGLAADGAGNIYVADYLDNRVKRIAPDGTVAAVAGNGGAGFGGDAGAATGAQLNGPTAVAVDRGNNLYIADFGNNRVRKVAADGTITTIAGSGVQSYSGDGNPAVAAGLNGPLGLAVDASGNLYIADSNNHAIREVTADGLIHTIAGTGVPGFLGDGGPPTSAQITGPSGLAIDSAGNLYVSDATMRIRKIFPGSIVTTIAGNGLSGYSGDYGLATLAALDGPGGLVLDGAGKIYVADAANNAIRLLQPAAPSAISFSAITNAASNQSGPVAPGEIVVLYGSGLGPAQLALAAPGPDGKIPTALGGTTVSFNGIAAPILYTSPNQVSAVVPFSITGANVQISIAYLGHPAAPQTLPGAVAAPGLFTMDYSGKGPAVAFNQNQQLNSTATPAARGSQLTLLVTGLGQTTPAGKDGHLAAAPLPAAALQPAVTIGGQPAAFVSATDVAGQIEGMMQITVQVPIAIQPANAVPVAVQVGGVSTPSGVTIAISQ